MKIRRECPTCRRQYIDAIAVGVGVCIATGLMWLVIFFYIANQPRIDCCGKLNEIRNVLDD